MKNRILLFFFAALCLLGNVWADVTISVTGADYDYTVSATRTTNLPTSGNSGYYVLEQWSYANNSNYRYVEESGGKVRYTTATSQNALKDVNIVKITNTGTAYTVQFVKTNNYIQNIVKGKQATTGSALSNLNFVASPTSGGFNIYNMDSSTDQLFFTSSGNNYPTGGTGPYAWGTFALYQVTANYTKSVTSKIQPYVNNPGDEYFKISESNATILSEKIIEFTGDNIVTSDEYNELLSYRDENIKYPTTGYYRLKSHQTGTYLYVENEANDMYVGDNKSDVASSVVYINRGAGNSFSIKIQGKYILTPGPSNGNDAKTGDVEVFFTPTLGSVTPEPGYMALSSGGRCFYPKGNIIKSWGPNSLVSHWTLTDASSITGNMTNANDNTGTGHSYATLCVPFAISSITGASAYVPTKDGNYLVMGDALESTIEAGTPVMLVGATDAGSYTAYIKTDVAPVSSPEDNALTGTFTGTSIDCTASTGTNYVLGFDRDNDNRIGFYHVNNASYNLKANRAYLNLTGGDARGFNIMFDVDDATGIVTPIGETEEGTVIYNLSGQRLNKMQKGINIVNGKKVLF